MLLQGSCGKALRAECLLGEKNAPQALQRLPRRWGCPSSGEPKVNINGLKETMVTSPRIMIKYSPSCRQGYLFWIHLK
jgi:hypothetical protein